MLSLCTSLCVSFCLCLCLLFSRSTYTVYSLPPSLLPPLSRLSPLASGLPPPPASHLSPFSADSSMWTAGLRKHCKTFERGEGGFWMADDDIVRFFYSLTVCKVRCNVRCGVCLVILVRVLCAKFVELYVHTPTSTHRTHARLVLATSYHWYYTRTRTHTHSYLFSPLPPSTAQTGGKGMASSITPPNPVLVVGDQAGNDQVSDVSGSKRRASTSKIGIAAYVFDNTLILLPSFFLPSSSFFLLLMLVLPSSFTFIHSFHTPW